MSSLNIFCSVCKIYFKNLDIIYSTRCGQVFHKNCIFESLEFSHSCPQCRRSCSQHNCHQIYVNFVEKSQLDNEIAIEVETSYKWTYMNPNIYLKHNLSHAFQFGQDEEGNDIYAARGVYNGDLMTGNYVPIKGCVIVTWEGKSYRVNQKSELLNKSKDDADYKWVAASYGDIPEYALETGFTAMGDIMYTARAKHKDKILYGKLNPFNQLAYMPYKGLEVGYSKYEVLVRIPKERNENSSNDSVITVTDG